GSRTRLNGSNGVVAQSVGGGGGDGGVNITGSISLTRPGGGAVAGRAVSIGIGGFGGDGGDAGAVNLTIRPPGADRVQVSAAGGAGVNITGQHSLTRPGGGALAGRAESIGIGGFGGDGGDAGAVNLTILPPGADRVQVSAIGDGSIAAMAQSLGGGGGNGRINVSGSITLDGQLTAGSGGLGGDGGLGRDVTAVV